MRWICILLIPCLTGCLNLKSDLQLAANGSGTLVVRYHQSKSNPEGFRAVDTPELKATTRLEQKGKFPDRITEIRFSSLQALERYFASLPRPQCPPFRLRRVKGDTYELTWKSAGRPMTRGAAPLRLEPGLNWNFTTGTTTFTGKPSVKSAESDFDATKKTFGGLKVVYNAKLPGAATDSNGTIKSDGSATWRVDGKDLEPGAQRRWDALSKKSKSRSRSGIAITVNSREPSHGMPRTASGLADMIGKGPFTATFRWPEGPRLVGDQWPPAAHVQEVITLNPPPDPTVRNEFGDGLLRLYSREITIERAHPYAKPKRIAEFEISPTPKMQIGTVIHPIVAGNGELIEPYGSLYMHANLTSLSAEAKIEFYDEMPEVIPEIHGKFAILHGQVRKPPVILSPPDFGSYALTWVDGEAELKPFRKGGSSVIIYCHPHTLYHVRGYDDLERESSSDGMTHGDRWAPHGDQWVILSNAHGIEPDLVDMRNYPYDLTALIWQRTKGSKVIPRLPLHQQLWQTNVEFRLNNVPTK